MRMPDVQKFDRDRVAAISSTPWSIHTAANPDGVFVEKAVKEDTTADIAKVRRFIFGRPTSTPLDTRQDVRNASPFWDAGKERPQHRTQTHAERESQQRFPRHLRVRRASPASTNGLIGLSQNGYRKQTNMLRRGGLLVMLNTLFPFPSFCRLILLKSLPELARPPLMLPHRLHHR